MKKKLKLRWQWKLLILILAFYGAFKLINYIDKLNKTKALACDKYKGYKCSIKEVEEYIKYGK